MRITYPNFSALFRRQPKAMAMIKGSGEYPNLQGYVWFYSSPYGVFVVTDIEGLPFSNDFCQSPVFAYHIHDGDRCTGNDLDPFADAGMHYNSNNCPHPYHAVDLPPLFGADGRAFSVTLTNRFTIEEVIGRVMIVHASPDDFTSQPSGNSGTKIACGKIIKI